MLEKVRGKRAKVRMEAICLERWTERRSRLVFCGREVGHRVQLPFLSSLLDPTMDKELHTVSRRVIWRKGWTRDQSQ